MTMPTGVQSDPNSPPSGTGAVVPPATTDPTNPPVVPPAAQSGAAKTYSEAEYQAVMARLSAADQKRDVAEKAAKKLTDAQLSDQERKDQELAEAKAAAAALALRVQEQALENEFLKDNTYAWYNADAALKLLEREGVTVDDKGKVAGMKAAIDKLAKDHAYLVKDGQSGTPTEPQQQGSTGSTGTTRQRGSNTSREDWEKRFPAMRGRVGG